MHRRVQSTQDGFDQDLVMQGFVDRAAVGNTHEIGTLLVI